MSVPRRPVHDGGPRVTRDWLPNDIGRCPITRSGGEVCGQPGYPGMPFVICGKHARKLYSHIHEDFTSMMPEARRRALTGDSQPLPVEEGVVYWLQIGALIKVGFTTNLKARRASYPPDHRVLAVEPQATRSLEAKRKAQFRHLVVHGQEWLRPAPELFAHINILRPDDQQIDPSESLFVEPHEDVA